MPSVLNPYTVAAARPRAWVIALHFDEVILARVDEIENGKSSVEAHLFTLTANRCFWPYMPRQAFRLPRTSLLRILPRDHQPLSVNMRNPIQRDDLPVSLSQATWDLFMDVRDAHHERLHDRSLAARKRDRRAQCVKNFRDD